MSEEQRQQPESGQERYEKARERRRQRAGANGGAQWGHAILETYPYPDETGTLLFEVVRFDTPDPGQRFRQRRPDGKGGHIWDVKGIRARVLYRLPAVIEAVKAGKRVLICEGERDANTNAPIGHAVHVMHATAPQVQQTSTERPRGILDTILHISSRERELINRLQYDGEDTPEIRDELNRLRVERDKPPLQPSELPD